MTTWECKIALDGLFFVLTSRRPAKAAVESRYEENAVSVELHVSIPQESSVTTVLRAGPSCDSCTVISGANDWILGNFIRVS